MLSLEEHGAVQSALVLCSQKGLCTGLTKGFLHLVSSRVFFWTWLYLQKTQFPVQAAVCVCGASPSTGPDLETPQILSGLVIFLFPSE